MTNRIEPPAPGMHENVSFEDYCAWDAVNNSSLGPALKSAAHYRWACDNPRQPTAAFQFGHLAHAGRLEPAAVLDRWIVMPDLTRGIDSKRPKATNEYKNRVEAWEAEQNALGKEVVEQQTYDEFKGLLDALHANKRARQWLSTDGPAEVSMVWVDEQTGLTCKGRIDKLTFTNLLVDLKTTFDAQDFGKSIANFAYHRQAAFYLDGYRQLTGIDASFGIIAAEKTAPFGVRAAPLCPEAINVGRQEYREALDTIAIARMTGEWCNYEDPDAWELPRWKQPKTATVFLDNEPLLIGDEL